MTLGPVRVMGAGVAVMMCAEEVRMYTNTIVHFFLWLLMVGTSYVHKHVNNFV